jgi:p-aminobenzoyl-glutamate transporter AbgT
MESEALMDNNKVNYAEVIGRLMMILTGFVLVMLGFITFIHAGDHKVLGILISFAGVVTMFGGIPDAE